MLNPDFHRQTGRSTVIALRLLAEAIETPGKVISIIDHHNSETAHHCLAHRVEELAGTLTDFRGVKVSHRKAIPTLVFLPNG